MKFFFKLATSFFLNGNKVKQSCSNALRQFQLLVFSVPNVLFSFVSFFEGFFLEVQKFLLSCLGPKDEYVPQIKNKKKQNQKSFFVTVTDHLAS
jgi:hypothetical protein